MATLFYLITLWLVTLSVCEYFSANLKDKKA